MRSSILAAANQLLAGTGRLHMLWPAQQLAVQQLQQRGLCSLTHPHHGEQQQRHQKLLPPLFAGAWSHTTQLSHHHQHIQHQQLPQQQLPHQQTRSMSFAVKVDRNNVDKALRNLNRHFRDEGMPQELRRREYRKDSAELKFESKRAAYNKRMGVLIAQRLKWVVKRRKLKM